MGLVDADPRAMNEATCRLRLAERSERVCERCGDPTKAVSLHHRRNRSQLHKSRHWELANVSHLCGDGVQLCHGWVTANPAAAREEGWHLRAWEEAADEPVLYRGEWVFLLPDGTLGKCVNRP